MIPLAFSAHVGQLESEDSARQGPIWTIAPAIERKMLRRCEILRPRRYRPWVIRRLKCEAMPPLGGPLTEVQGGAVEWRPAQLEVRKDYPWRREQ